MNLLDAFPHPFSEAHGLQLVLWAQAQQPETAFTLEVNGEAVGMFHRYPQRDVYRGSAEVGFWLGRAYWGRGIATTVLRSVVEHTFANTETCRLFAQVFEWAPASMRVLEKAGFLCEARLRRAVIKDGRTGDAFLYAIIREG
jgi:RimJ/RimL family protein N-acetyltransferase